MPQTNYTVNLIDPEGLETFSVKDQEIINSFTINSEFKAFENKIEFHIYSLDGVLLTSDFGYKSQSYLGSSQRDPDGKIVEMTIDPVDDIKKYAQEFNVDLERESKSKTIIAKILKLK